ncbi:hypothetical protein BaRGS_00016006 [Batillaria attramentaria]|uniref:Uncharacterized protein n=1 Tax=Batillaria attramentaria TaxID=370345 RepID=A0ABD0KZN0_9CAEN
MSMIQVFGKAGDLRSYWDYADGESHEQTRRIIINLGWREFTVATVFYSRARGLEGGNNLSRLIKVSKQTGIASPEPLQSLCPWPVEIVFQRQYIEAVGYKYRTFATVGITSGWSLCKTQIFI